jgi:hypothetical protein
MQEQRCYGQFAAGECGMADSKDCKFRRLSTAAAKDSLHSPIVLVVRAER